MGFSVDAVVTLAGVLVAAPCTIIMIRQSLKQQSQNMRSGELGIAHVVV